MATVHTVRARPLAPASTRFTRALEKRVLARLRRDGIMRPGERAVVAVSGGPDSTALLLIISRRREELGVELTAAHFDHRLRSRAEATADRRFVEDLCRDLDIDIACSHGDVRARAAKAGQSLEDAARRMRYEFLGRTAKKLGATAVVLGHTRDDLAETVLLHLLRGSGLDGLIGMRPRGAWPFGAGPDLSRPLLVVSREDTVRYCREAGVTPRDDPTNELPIAARNMLRGRVMPALRALNPRLDEAMARLARAAARDVDYLEAAAAQLWQDLASAKRGEVRFPREGLAAVHPALLARLFRRAFAELRGAPDDLEAVHMEALLVSLPRRRFRMDLPHGVSAVLTPAALTFRCGAPPVTPAITQTALAVPGSLRAGRWTLGARLVRRPGSLTPGDPLRAYLDAAFAGRPLSVRSRRPGDRLRPLGLRGQKKVQDLLVDAKVPVEERDGLPLLCDELGVLWVPGAALADRAAVPPDAAKVLRVTARRR
jgi:tRNA(Ile)-lysidine synthase